MPAGGGERSGAGRDPAAPDPGDPAEAPAELGGGRIAATALQLALAAGLAAAATSGWTRLGEGRGPLVAVALGSVSPPLLALGATALWGRRWPSWAALPGHVTMLALLAVILAGGPGPAGRAVSGGWARLLSTILPAGPGSEVEVLALVVAGGAAVLGTELALRSRAAALPALPALLALVATRMATQGVAAPRLLGPAVAVALLAGALALVRAGSLRPGLGLAVVLAAAVTAAAIAPALPWDGDRRPFDPRALRHLSPLESGAVNPLARLHAWQAAPERVLFQARLSEPATLRLAVLDRYDGVRFAAAPRFTPAGSVLPAPPPTDPGDGGPTREVTADIVVAALDGPWVPAPDRPRRVSGPAVAVDAATGVVVVPGGVRPGQRYRVVAGVPRNRLAQLPGARPAPADQVGPAASATPPGLPAQVAELARTAAGDPADPPLVRLGRLQELFRAGFSEDPTSPPGHSLARLTSFLDPADRVGSSEQLATGFALLARSLGYPTRVAVGFRPAGQGDVAVRGADAQAWPEVALAGPGWVAFDPVPPRADRPGGSRPPPEEAQEASLAAAAAQAAATPPGVPPPDPVPPSPAAARVGHRAWLALAAGGGAALLLAGALTLGLVVAVKRRRRSGRRAQPDPGARVRGAWAEAADRLVERGVGGGRSATPRDTVCAVAVVSAAASAPLADLGELAERAAFAGPGAVAEPDADRAWADLDLLEAALDAQDGRLTALRRAVDPRPLASRS